LVTRAVLRRISKKNANLELQDRGDSEEGSSREKGDWGQGKEEEGQPFTSRRDGKKKTKEKHDDSLPREGKIRAKKEHHRKEKQLSKGRAKFVTRVIKLAVEWDFANMRRGEE